jgi:GntR family transcriptional regulator
MSNQPTNTTSQPKYEWLRECLLSDINSGKYPLGSLLPPEIELGRIYGVSRHTVRGATQKLVDNGLIARHPGIGTVVCAANETSTFIAALGSLQELFNYTNTTRLELLGHTTMIADAKLVASLACEPDSEWVALRARRYIIGQITPISFSEIFLRPEFGSIKDLLRGQHMSIYNMLEQNYGQVIHVVRQEIAAILMPAGAARQLDVKSRSPALHLQRSYLDKKNRLLAVSSNTYAADRFHLSTSWSKGSKRK